MFDVSSKFTFFIGRSFPHYTPRAWIKKKGMREREAHLHLEMHVWCYACCPYLGRGTVAFALRGAALEPPRLVFATRGSFLGPTPLLDKCVFTCDTNRRATRWHNVCLFFLSLMPFWQETPGQPEFWQHRKLSIYKLTVIIRYTWQSSRRVEHTGTHSHTHSDWTLGMSRTHTSALNTWVSWKKYNAVY